MMGFQISGSAQSFNWLNGGTGRSMGSGVTVDSWNRTYVVGAFAPNLSNQFGLAPGLVPSFTLGAEDHVAYLSRYNTSNGNPELVSVISLSSNGQFCNTGTAGYVMADRVAVASNGQIYVLGVFKGCNLDLHDSQGNSIITTNSSFDSRYFQKVFVAVYDSSFRPLSCHILYGFNNGFDYFSGDIKRGYRPSQDPDVMEEKIFFAASVIGEQALVETFGTLPSSHSTAFNPITIPDQAAYDIYVGQIDVAANGIDHAVIIGGDGDDHPSALASGYLGLPEFSDHLYLTGAFHGNISFNHPTLGIQTFTSNGRSDLFTCRFLAFDLNSQEAVVAGGPWDDQALAITDNGRYVGGAISESAQFGGTFTFTPTLGALTACTGYLPGDRKEVGFIARADYASQTWASVDSIFERDEDTQVMTMASARCDDFYAVVSQGIHPDRIRVPYLNYDHGCFTGSGSCHNYFSTITKWHDQGTQAALLWEHSFVPPNPITYPVAATRYIEDMEYVFDNSGMGVPDLSSNYYNDVLFTGRFGDFFSL